MDEAVLCNEEHLHVDTSGAAHRFFSEEDNHSDESVIIDEPLTDDTVIASETCSESTSLSNDTNASSSGRVTALGAKSVVSETNSEESTGSRNADLHENDEPTKSVTSALAEADTPCKVATLDGSGSGNISNFSDTSSELLLKKTSKSEVELTNKVGDDIGDSNRDPVNPEFDIVPSSIESVLVDDDDDECRLHVENISIVKDVEEVDIIKELSSSVEIRQSKQVAQPDKGENGSSVEVSGSVVISSDEESVGSGAVEVVSSDDDDDDDDVKEVSSDRRDPSGRNVERSNKVRNTKHKFYRRDDLGKYIKDDDICTEDLEFSKSLGVDYLDPYEHMYDFPAYMDPSRNKNTEEEKSISQCTNFSSLSPFSSGDDKSPVETILHDRGADTTDEQQFINVDIPQVTSAENSEIAGFSSSAASSKDRSNSIGFAKDATAGCDSSYPIDLDQVCSKGHTTSSVEHDSISVNEQIYQEVVDPSGTTDDDNDDKNVDILVEMISDEAVKSPEYLLNGSCTDNSGGSEMLETLITAMNDGEENEGDLETDNLENLVSPTYESFESENTVHIDKQTTALHNASPNVTRKQEENLLNDISASFSESIIPDVVEAADVVIGPQGFPAWMQQNDSSSVTCSCSLERGTVDDDAAEETAPGVHGCPKCFQRQQTGTAPTHHTASYWKSTSDLVNGSFESNVKKKRRKKKRVELAPKSVSMCLDDFLDGASTKKCKTTDMLNHSNDIIYSSEEQRNETVTTSEIDTTLNMEQCVDGGTTSNVDDSQSEMVSFVREYSCLSEPRELLVSRDEFKTRKEDNHLRGCLWSPDGCSVLTNSDDNILRLFNIPDDISDTVTVEALSATVKMAEGETVYDMNWYPYMQSQQPDTCCFLTTSRDHPVHLWDSANGVIRCSYRAFDQMDELTSAHCVSFNMYGDKIYCGYNKCVRVFDSSRPGNQCEERCTVEKKNQSRKRRAAFSDSQSGIISSIAFSESCGLYACGSFAKTVGLYDISNGSMSCVLRGHNGGVTQVKFTSDGYYLISGARKDSEMIWWDLRNTTIPLFKLLRNVSTNQRIQFDIDRESTHVFSGSTDNTVSIWDLQQFPNEVDDDVISYQPTIRFNAHGDAVNAVCLHPTKPLLASTSGQRHFYNDSDTDTSSGETVTSTPKGVDNSMKIWLL